MLRALTSHQCVPGSIPAPCVTCGLSLLLVPFLALRGFSPGTQVFPAPQKPTYISKFQFDLDYCQALIVVSMVYQASPPPLLGFCQVLNKITSW